MTANPPETRLPPIAHGSFLRCRPMLNLQKDIFSIRIRSLAPGDHMLSQKLFVDVAFTYSLAKTCHRRCKSTRSATHSLALLLSAFSPWREAHTNIEKIFTLKTMFLLLLRPSKIFIFFRSAQSSEWCLSGKPSPSPSVFTNLSAHSPPMAAEAGRKKQSMIESPILYIQSRPCQQCNHFVLFVSLESLRRVLIIFEIILIRKLIKNIS